MFHVGVEKQKPRCQMVLFILFKFRLFTFIGCVRVSNANLIHIDSLENESVNDHTV